MINFVLFLLVLIVSPLLAAGEAQWTPALNEDGIQIYTRPVTDSPFAAVKGVLTSGAPLERVVAKLGNDDECAEWRQTCKSTRVLQQVPENERIVYMIIDLPWPLTDRDVVSRISGERSSQTGSLKLHIKSEPDRQPNKEYVRAISNGTFELIPIGANETRFIFTMHSDMGGDLPADRINTRMPESTLEDLRYLRKLAEGS